MFQGTLPKQLLPRIGTPSRRGRRPRDSPLSQSMLGAADPHQAAAMAASLEAAQLAQLMAAGFGKMPMPFGSIPGLGFNPMLGLPGFGLGLPGLQTEMTPTKSEKSKDSKGGGSKSSSSKDDSEKAKREREEEENASPHHSFPMMFNPLSLYNPALFAAHGMANFPLPTSMAGLLDPSLLNGHSGKEETSTRPSSRDRERERERDRERDRDMRERERGERDREKSRKKSELFDHGMVEDLSFRSKRKQELIENTTVAHSSGKAKLSKEQMSFESDDMPCDLSMKSKSKDDKSKQKICVSDKLSRIVDTLKCRVNKMDEKSSKYSEEDYTKASLDTALNLKKTESHSESGGLSHRDREESASTRSSGHSSSHKHSPSSISHSNHHTSKEPVPKIVQELLAAKQHRELEEMQAAKKHDSLAAKQMKALKESMKSSSKSSTSQSEEKSKASDSKDSD